jgi:hypothetical protein
MCACSPTMYSLDTGAARALRSVLLALLILLAGACAGPDQLETVLPRQGETVSGDLVLPRIRLPLPDGEWTVIGRQTYYNDIYRVNADLLLIRTTINEFGEQEVSDLLSISTNLEPGAGGFENICTGEVTARFLLAGIESDRILSQDCWGIDHMEMSFSEEQIRENRDLAEARDYLRSNGILVPINMIYAKHRLSDAYDYLTIWRFFNPDLAGIPQTRYADHERSDWHKDNIGGFPDKRVYAERLGRQAESWQGELRRGFF